MGEIVLTGSHGLSHSMAREGRVRGRPEYPGRRCWRGVCTGGETAARCLQEETVRMKAILIRLLEKLFPVRRA